MKLPELKELEGVPAGTLVMVPAGALRALLTPAPEPTGPHTEVEIQVALRDYADRVTRNLSPLEHGQTAEPVARVLRDEGREPDHGVRAA